MQVELSRTTPQDPAAVVMHEALYREADERGGLPPPIAVPAMPVGLTPPTGALLIAHEGLEPVGIGGVRHLGTDVAEVKSMYVRPSHRGRGVARRLLEELESIAREHGCLAVRLDSSRYLTEAVSLYRSAGYEEIADYNGNRSADIWFERPLTSG
ncbi:MAG TPA: GNAT family N-acetyltransferase [Solirubrobacterales bacterium]